MGSDLRRAAHKLMDAYLDAGGPDDLVIMSRNDWERNVNVAGFMTGQEWYDRFEKAYRQTLNYGSQPSGIVGEVLDAAKKAAGIKQ